MKSQRIVRNLRKRKVQYNCFPSLIFNLKFVKNSRFCSSFISSYEHYCKLSVTICFVDTVPLYDMLKCKITGTLAGALIGCVILICLKKLCCSSLKNILTVIVVLQIQMHCLTSLFEHLLIIATSVIIVYMLTKFVSF